MDKCALSKNFFLKPPPCPLMESLSKSKNLRSNNKNSNCRIAKIKSSSLSFKTFGGPRRTQLSGGRLHCWLVNASKLIASADRTEMPAPAT